ncbi:MAG: hypothetical protein Ta2B_29080 [Termitinemataceae bacterium]|nr:MAG: hypothetical protein Ta2B_29080 [Termitinemataceae bacterium]
MNTIFEKIIKIFETPISTMSAAVLLITASTRTAFAIITFGSIFWVFVICFFIKKLLVNVIPKNYSSMIDILISSFIAGTFYLTIFMLNPFLAMESVLWILLTPVLFCSMYTNESPEYERKLSPENNNEIDLTEILTRIVTLGSLILIIALIREPLGFASLSIPGGSQGIIEIFNVSNDYPLPVQIMSYSSGAFFLLAYILVILRYLGVGSIKKEKLR